MQLPYPKHRWHVIIGIKIVCLVFIIRHIVLVRSGFPISSFLFFCFIIYMAVNKKTTIGTFGYE